MMTLRKKSPGIEFKDARVCTKEEEDVLRARVLKQAGLSYPHNAEIKAQCPNPYTEAKVDDDSVFSPAPVNHDYNRLREVLHRAFHQAATGKGAARHGQGKPFEEQPMQTLSRSLGTNAGLLYQAAKKAQESLRLDCDAAVFELLGAINYLAGAIIYLEDEDVD